MLGIDMNTVYAGLQVMIYGLSGVFVVLILFYLLIKMILFTAQKL